MAIKSRYQWFGRIGRAGVSRNLRSRVVGKDIEVVAVNDIVPADNLAYLLKYDSTTRRFQGTVSSEKSGPSVTEDDTLLSTATR